MADAFRARRRSRDGAGGATLTAAGQPLDANRLQDLLREVAFVSRLEVLSTVDSTNDHLRRLADRGAGEGTTVVAETQTAGRGRLGRRWESPPGVGLYVSVLCRPRRPPVEVTRWTLAAAVAACAAARDATGRPVAIKWPNDLVYRGRKLAGVLAELRSAAGEAFDLVLGTGVNVGQRAEEFDPEIADRATSLRLIAGGAVVDREAFAARYLKQLGELSDRLRQGMWSEVARCWEELAPGAHGQRVEVIGAGPAAESYHGVTQGLSSDGGMRVRRNDGSDEVVRLAESLVPMES